MNPLDFECPKCGAWAGQKCLTIKTGRSTDTHVARHALAYEIANQAPVHEPGCNDQCQGDDHYLLVER